MADDTRHDRHDREAIAAAADRMGPARFAQALLAACTDCARLYADLQALAVALPATATPARPRDFTLSTADAERLRPRGLRHWFGLIGSARDTVTRPLAVGLTTLGLAGLLVATVPGGLSMAGSSGAAASAAPMVVMEAQPSGAAASGATTLGQAAPEPGRGSNVDPGRDTQAPVPPQADTAEATGAAVPPVMILSLAFFVAGIGVFAVRRLAAARSVR